jgi:hypothetical protein
MGYFIVGRLQITIIIELSQSPIYNHENDGVVHIFWHYEWVIRLWGKGLEIFDWEQWFLEKLIIVS